MKGKNQDIRSIKLRYVSPETYVYQFSAGVMDNTVSGPESQWDAKASHSDLDDDFDEEK